MDVMILNQARSELSRLDLARSTLRSDLITGLVGLRHHARRFTGGDSAADDLLQETALRAWRALDTFVPGTNLNAWLFTIMRNYFFTAFRDNRRETDDPDGEHAAKLSSRPEQEGHLLLLEVTDALSQLTSDMQTAVQLICLEGWSYEEAGAMCGCAEGTMKSRAHRGRQALARILGWSLDELAVD